MVLLKTLAVLLWLFEFCSFMMQHFNIHPFIGLHSSECTYGGLSVRQLLPAEWKIALGGQTDFSEFFFFYACVQPDFLYATCYMLCCQKWFFSALHGKEKLIAKRTKNLFSNWLGEAECQGWRRTAVGEGWPTRCLLPLPCLAAQSLWQNKPPGILGKYWEPLSGICTVFRSHRSQKSSTLPNLSPLPSLNWMVASVSHCHRRYDIVMIVKCLFTQWLHIWASHLLPRCCKKQTNIFL